MDFTICIHFTKFRHSDVEDSVGHHARRKHFIEAQYHNNNNDGKHNLNPTRTYQLVGLPSLFPRGLLAGIQEFLFSEADQIYIGLHPLQGLLELHPAIKRPGVARKF